MTDKKNPWLITDIEEFHFYCCPECQFKDHSNEIFVNHVFQAHPYAKEFLEINQFIDDNESKKILSKDAAPAPSAFDVSDILMKLAPNINNVQLPSPVHVYVKEEAVEDAGDFINPTDLKVETFIDISNQNVLKQEKLNSDLPKKSKKKAKNITKKEKKGDSEKSNSDLPKKSKKKDKNIGTYDEKDTKCQDCGKILSSLSNLKTHIKAVHEDEGQRPHQCYICGKSYKWSENLNYHMDYTHLKKTLQCPQCEKSFSTKQTVARHIKVVHEGIPVEKNHICDKCSRSYSDNGKLMRHIKTFHDKIYEFKCEICPKEYAKKDQLKHHMESVHEKVRMKCDICGKVTDRQSLKSHMKFVHEKKQKWKCDICSKIFYKPGHLKNHFWAIHRKEINHGAAKEYRIE